MAYGHDASSPEKQKVSQDLVKRGLRARSMALSTQVLSEFYVVATRKLGISPVDALREMDLLSRAQVVQPTLATIFESVGLAQSEQLSFWAAMILVSASAARTSILYTEDLAHDRVIRGVRITNPYLASG